jgi:hypothetical protein
VGVQSGPEDAAVEKYELSFAKTSSLCPTRLGASEIRGQDAEPGWR